MPDAMTPGPENEPEHESPGNERRRDFLKTLGKAAVITPPAMTVLLSTSLNSPAIAASGGKSPYGKGKPPRGKPPRGKFWHGKFSHGKAKGRPGFLTKFVGRH